MCPLWRGQVQLVSGILKYGTSKCYFARPSLNFIHCWFTPPPPLTQIPALSLTSICRWYSLVCSVNKASDVEKVQCYPNVLVRWCKDNHIELNNLWCKVMTVSRSRKVITDVYYVNGRALQVVEFYKYFGIISSRDLSWSKHVDYVIGKCSRLSV